MYFAIFARPAELVYLYALNCCFGGSELNLFFNLLYVTCSNKLINLGQYFSKFGESCSMLGERLKDSSLDLVVGSGPRGGCCCTERKLKEQPMGLRDNSDN